VGGNLELESQSKNVRSEIEQEYNKKETFTELFNTYKTGLYRFVLYLTKNQSEADDLFQETWYRAVKYYSNENEISNFRACLFTIALNINRDMIRKKKIRRIFSFIKDSNTPQDGLEQSLGDTYSQEDTITTQVEFEICLKRAMSKLPARQRHIFILKEIEGFKHEEVASMLDIAVGTVKAHLHRAHKYLQKELAEFYIS
jgi:RNA polymerase sigma-70 factor (ECF subfamily)